MSGTSYKKLYSLFRDDGMSVFESFYNAVYISSHNRYEATATEKKKTLENVTDHPVSWSEDKKKIYKNNCWSVIVKLLDGIPKITNGFVAAGRRIGAFFRKIALIPHSLDTSPRAVKAFFRVVGKSLLPLGAIVFAVFTVARISLVESERVAVGVYVEGEYVGNTSSVGDVFAIKEQYERTLSDAYGTPTVLLCDISFLPQTFDEKTSITSGDVSIFDAYVQSATEQGYGLYIDNKLAAVTPVKSWIDEAIDDYIEKQTRNYYAEYSLTDENIDRFAFNNNISIIADRYPKSYFLTRSEIRQLFSLSLLSDSDEKLLRSYMPFIKWDDFEGKVPDTFSSTLTLDYSNLDTLQNSGADDFQSAVPSESVLMDIAIIRDASEKETLPFDVDYVYDDTLYEGMRRLVRDGSDGVKVIYYKATYLGDKLVRRDVSGEEIVKEPVNKIVRVGTKELPNGDKSLIPTGTYIYPYNGLLTSRFGWRMIGSQNSFHKGLDIYGSYGDTIVASDGGEVIEVNYSSGYGNYVMIRHNEETVTRYAHCSEIDVEVGDLVAQGFPIAKLGQTGNATGVHVHFEMIINGTAVDPTPYMTGSLKEYILA